MIAKNVKLQILCHLIMVTTIIINKNNNRRQHNDDYAKYEDVLKCIILLPKI